MDCLHQWNDEAAMHSRMQTASMTVACNWPTHVHQVTGCKVTEAVEHKHRQFKVDTLLDSQPVEVVTFCWWDAVELPSASYQSRCGIEYTLQLPQVDVVWASLSDEKLETFMLMNIERHSWWHHCWRYYLCCNEESTSIFPSYCCGNRYCACLTNHLKNFFHCSYSPWLSVSLNWYLVVAIEPFCCTEISTRTYRMLPFLNNSGIGAAKLQW